LVLLLVAGLVAAVIALAYSSWRSSAIPSLLLLAEYEPCHRSTRDRSWGKETVTVYSFPAYHDSVCYSTREELMGLGCTEFPPYRPPDYNDWRFNLQHRGASAHFQKEEIWTSVRITILKGRFLARRADGTVTLGGDLDWGSVVITETRRPFSLRELLRRCRRKLPGRNRRQRPPQPPPRPPAPPSSRDAFTISPRKGRMMPRHRVVHSGGAGVMAAGSQMPQNPRVGDSTYYRVIISVTPLA
jgi:hypothetical protein